MLTRWFRRLRRRRRIVPAGKVLVDADAYQQLLEQAVVGEAFSIVLAEEENWLALDPEPEQ